MIAVKGGDSMVTLQKFAGVVESELAGGLTRAMLQDAAGKDSVKLAKWTRAYSLEGLQDHLSAKVVGFLQEDAAGIFASAWSKCAEIKQTADDTRKTGKSSSIVLTDHEFSYGIDPEVDVLVDGVLLGRFPFSVKMLCTVSALELALEGGCVTSIAMGKAAGGTVIELAGQPVWKKEFVHADLPGTLKFKRPLVI